MYSELSKREFHETLRLNTRVGNPNLKLSPLGAFPFPTFEGYSNIYYGMFDEHSFLLITNFVMKPDSYYGLRGNYFERHDRLVIEFEVDYINKASAIMLKYGAALFLIITNSVMIAIKMPLFLFIAWDTCILIAYLLWRWIDKRKKRKLELDFVKHFQLFE